MEISRLSEILSAITCLWSIWLNTRRNSAAWPIGLFSVLLAGWVYFEDGLLAESGLQIFYFLSGIYGWKQWRASEKSSSEKKIAVEKLSVTESSTGLLIAVLISMLIYLILKQFPRSSSPLPDALLTGFSLLAQFWLARRKLENWLLWFFINLGSVLLYLQRELWFFAALYAALLLLAVRGYSEWKNQKETC